MAIRKRLREDSEAEKQWNGNVQSQFNSDESLSNFHASMWEEYVPKIMQRIKDEDPNLHGRLSGDISWDRKLAGILYFMAGSPTTKPGRVKAVASPSPKKQLPLKLKLKRKTGNG